jgi:hypothetical protein
MIFVFLIIGVIFSLLAMGAIFLWPQREKRLNYYPFEYFPVPNPPKIEFHVFERRAYPREPLNVKIECRDLARLVYSGNPFEVKVVDISPKGCQILSNKEIPHTALLYLKFNTMLKKNRLAFVVYCRNLGFGYQAGLEFLPQA